MKHHYYSAILIKAIFFTSLLFNNANAQQSENKKMAVGIYDFLSDNTGGGVAEAKTLTAIVTEIISGNSRFDPINRTFSKQVQEELDLNKREEYLMSEIAEQGKQSGAIKIITGRVISIKVSKRDQTENVGKAGSVIKVPKVPQVPQAALTGTNVYSFDAYLKFEMRLIDVATNKIESAETFDLDANSLAVDQIGGSEETAIKNVNKKARRTIATWIAGLLPYDLVVLRPEATNKKEEPTSVLIQGGDDIGMEKGLNLMFVEEEQIGGDVRYKPIGTLEIVTVEPKFSTAAVTSGKEELKKLLDAGKHPKVQIVEKEKK